MPLDEAIAKLQEIRRQYPEADIQLWSFDASGEEMRVTEFEVTPGTYMVQVNVL